MCEVDHSLCVFMYIQGELLDEAVKALPDAIWWIKCDGSDVVPGLTESARKQWSGDVDMGDGAVQKQYEEYLKRIEVVNRIGRNLHDHKERMDTLKDLDTIKKSLKSDLSFIPTGKCNIIIKGIVSLYKGYF